jgi:hypothetical protein
MRRGEQPRFLKQFESVSVVLRAFCAGGPSG